MKHDNNILLNTSITSPVSSNSQFTNLLSISNYISMFNTSAKDSSRYHGELWVNTYQNYILHDIFPNIMSMRKIYLTNEARDLFYVIPENFTGIHLLIANNTKIDFLSNQIYTTYKQLNQDEYDLDRACALFPEFSLDFELFEHLAYDIDGTLYQDLSTADFKLYYPEPHIASPSFAHEDIWFMHILHYQHWLWFFFISLIMFYFITFINVVHWCNPRVKPKRETRGVSRSKCADLITACVPVSWAMSIIITESVDAADYHDGFGTGEIVIGIRAYQWGWEYFYPNSLDLNYSDNPSYASVTGASLRYSNTSSNVSKANTLWKHYQNTNVKLSQNPSNLLLSPNNNFNILNFINMKDIGGNTLYESNAFTTIKSHSKIPTFKILSDESDFTFRYNKIKDLYLNESHTQDATTYVTNRQHDVTSLNTLPSKYSQIDTTSFNKFLEYNLNKPSIVSNNLRNNLKTTSLQDNTGNKTNLNLNKIMYNNTTLNTFRNYNSNNLSVLTSDRSIRNTEFYPKNSKNIIDVQSNFNKIETSALPSAPVLPSTNVKYGFSKPYINGTSPVIFKGKEDSLPLTVLNNYWMNTGSLNNTNTYVDQVCLKKSMNNNFYLPTIDEYAEYDFKNQQTLELIEDLYWEGNYSSLVHEEYCSLLNKILKPTYKNFILFPNQESIFNKTNFLKLKDYNLITSENLPDYFDEIFENQKYVDNLHTNTKIITRYLDTNFIPATSYVSTLNSFRPTYDEQLWNSSLVNCRLLDSLNIIDETQSNDTRSDNYFNLRSTAKNSIVTYNATQKVFKSRYDEGRSNARISDIANSFNPYLFISTSRPNYEDIITKNKDYFFRPHLYKSVHFTNFTNVCNIFQNNNTYTNTIPFLVSLQSDASRYFWHDWSSRWNSIEVLPSSVARYSLLGLPYENKIFNFSSQSSDELNESETYLTKLSHSRKNYLNIWSYSPYLYTRLSSWYRVNESTDYLYNITSVTNFKSLLKFSSIYWEPNTKYKSYLATNSSPTYSNLNLPGRSITKNIEHLTSVNYNINSLVDLLTKREFLYRKFLFTKKNTYNLPNYLSSKPTNPLFLEIKSAFPFFEPTSFNNEISRDFLFSYIIDLEFNLLSRYWNNLSAILPNEIISNNIYTFLYRNPQIESLSTNKEFFKNPYRPMKKGITNMVRLHTTEAVSIPIEIRVHLLASSKDVIHSWSIPSAGIKIDCVPGYSSHRVAIFLLSGTYYGQCMEICGRFHHWMPIVVHFLKRDMFILWCAQMSLSRIKEYNQMNYPVVFSSNQWDNINYKN